CKSPPPKPRTGSASTAAKPRASPSSWRRMAAPTRCSFPTTSSNPCGLLPTARAWPSANANSTRRTRTGSLHRTSTSRRMDSGAKGWWPGRSPA
ncbi:MAG: hypothetical protein AVDCRST_MAG51-201, partial [uncultured Ramlibacter sp.]